MDKQRIEAIDALLPQTQCTRCGYPDCRRYASAVAHEQASYNQCPPGGQRVVKRLAELLDKPEIDLNPEYGTQSPRTTAVIDEQRCIGCTLCIQACPVDAIMGSAKHMHTVLQAYCTGCDLCLAPCPVDCIDMVPLRELAASGNAVATQLVGASLDDLADAASSRYEAHKIRITRHKRKQSKRLKAHDITGHYTQSPNASANNNARKNAVIAAALKRARARRLARENARTKTD